MTSVAWAAGLFEGEGSFGMRTPPAARFPILIVQLVMTDRDVVERFAEIVGCGTINTTRRALHPEWKDAHHWRAYGPKAKIVAAQLEPFLGDRRRDRLAEILFRVEVAHLVPCRDCAEVFYATSNTRSCSSCQAWRQNTRAGRRMAQAVA